MTEKTIEIGVIGTGEGWASASEAKVHGRYEGDTQDAKPQPIFRKLTENEIKDFLAL